ncbi:hypothetical protein ACOKW7_09305 [Limnospira platensis CENA597]|uniref:hypothetical protein n=1 Tax=Limnospira platensis TaxID=118562 RepID=UPI003DA0CF9C
MINLHYKGIFSLNGELVQSHYKPHKFDQNTIIVAYQVLTHIEEHKTPEFKNITYQVMGSYRPRGDYQGSAIIKLTKQSQFRVQLSGKVIQCFGMVVAKLQPESNHLTQSTINN